MRPPEYPSDPPGRRNDSRALPTVFVGPALVADWSKVLSLTACCLSPSEIVTSDFGLGGGYSRAI